MELNSRNTGHVLVTKKWSDGSETAKSSPTASDKTQYITQGKAPELTARLGCCANSGAWGRGKSQGLWGRRTPEVTREKKKVGSLHGSNTGGHSTSQEHCWHLNPTQLCTFLGQIWNLKFIPHQHMFCVSWKQLRSKEGLTQGERPFHSF